MRRHNHFRPHMYNDHIYFKNSTPIIIDRGSSILIRLQSRRKWFTYNYVQLSLTPNPGHYTPQMTLIKTFQGTKFQGTKTKCLKMYFRF